MQKYNLNPGDILFNPFSSYFFEIVDNNGSVYGSESPIYLPLESGELLEYLQKNNIKYKKLFAQIQKKEIWEVFFPDWLSKSDIIKEYKKNGIWD